MKKPDYSKLVTLHLSPTEAAIMIGILEGTKQLRGPALGVPMCDFIDGSIGHMRLQLRQLNWPGYNKTPYPV
jgi:hypothetical protein